MFKFLFSTKSRSRRVSSESECEYGRNEEMHEFGKQCYLAVYKVIFVNKVENVKTVNRTIEKQNVNVDRYKGVWG